MAYRNGKEERNDIFLEETSAFRPRSRGTRSSGQDRLKIRWLIAGQNNRKRYKIVKIKER
jgi:hypothetical protein